MYIRFGAQNGLWKLVIDDDGRGFGFTGRLTLTELDDLQRGPTVIKERVRAIGGARVIDSAIERIQIVQALQLGARGVVMKEAATQLLMKAIRTVMAGEYWIGREAVGDIVEFMRLNASGDRPPKNFGLTKREMDILTTIVAGLSNKEIARKFALSEDTVKHHLTNIFDKVGVGSRLELALFAINNRITDQPS